MVDASTITLKSNLTTGYRWRRAKPWDEAILELLRVEFTGPETDLVGAGGEETWSFAAMRQGKAVVALEYVHPWEKNGLAAETRTFTVVVH
jgi:predicted secreted protein